MLVEFAALLEIIIKRNERNLPILFLWVRNMLCGRYCCHFISFLVEYGQALLDRVIEDVLDLQLVLVVGVALTQMSELLGLVEAPLQVLGGDEVLGNFNAVVYVADLYKYRNKRLLLLIQTAITFKSLHFVLVKRGLMNQECCQVPVNQDCYFQ